MKYLFFVFPILASLASLQGEVKADLGSETIYSSLDIGSLEAARCAANRPGPTGPTGPTGATGPTGDRGRRGPMGDPGTHWSYWRGRRNRWSW